MCSSKNIPMPTVTEMAIAELDLHWALSTDGFTYAIDHLESRLLKTDGILVFSAPVVSHRGEWEPRVTPPCADWKVL